MSELSGKRLPSFGDDPFFDLTPEQKELLKRAWEVTKPIVDKAFGSVLVYGTAGDIKDWNKETFLNPDYPYVLMEDPYYNEQETKKEETKVYKKVDGVPTEPIATYKGNARSFGRFFAFILSNNGVSGEEKTGEPIKD